MHPYTVTRPGDDSAVVRLTGELTIEHVRELHAALCVAAPVPRRLRVEGAEVTRLDAAAVQLLFAAARAAEVAEIAGRSRAWSEAFARYGLNDPFSETH